MKKAILATALITSALSINAKELHLDCNYSTTEGRSEVTKIVLDLDNKMGSTYDRIFSKTGNGSWLSSVPEGETKSWPVSSGSGDLYSNAETYWFSVPNSSGYDKFQIDRNDLTIVMDGMSPSPIGSCKIIEAPETLI